MQETPSQTRIKKCVWDGVFWRSESLFRRICTDVLVFSQPASVELTQIKPDATSVLLELPIQAVQLEHQSIVTDLQRLTHALGLEWHGE
jgi:hypothetical protein